MSKCALVFLGMFALIVGLFISVQIAEKEKDEWRREAIRLKAKKQGGRPPCIHGNLCRAYMREAHCILRQACPSGCEFYKPKEVSDELGQS